MLCHVMSLATDMERVKIFNYSNDNNNSNKKHCNKQISQRQTVECKVMEFLIMFLCNCVNAILKIELCN